jgi:hypothetical protein
MGTLGALFHTAGRPGKERTFHDCASLRDAPPVTSLTAHPRIMTNIILNGPIALRA